MELALLLAFVLVAIGVWRMIKIVPPGTAGIVERLGSYRRTLSPGVNVVVPLVDRLRPFVDLREQVVNAPQLPVITADDHAVIVDAAIYLRVTDPKAATYEVADLIAAVEQLALTTLRNVVGGMSLERTLWSREECAAELRRVLDEETQRWGIQVNWVEIKAIDPPGEEHTQPW